MKDPDCIFCKIVAGDLPAVKVWEDDEHLAFLDVNPVKPGHTLLIPKVHQSYVFDMSDDRYNELWHKAKLLAPTIQSAMKSKRMGIAVEGISVDHVHIHLIPVNRMGDVDPNSQKHVDTKELAEIAAKIRAGFLASDQE